MQGLTKAYLGSTEISKAYLGNTLVYDGEGIPLAVRIKGAAIFTDDFEGEVSVWNLNGEYNTGSVRASSTIQTDESALSGTHVLRMRADDTNVGNIARTNNMRYNIFASNEDVVIEFFMRLPQIIDHEINDNSFTNVWQVKGVNEDGDNRNDPLWVLSIDNRGGKGSGNPNYLTLSYLGQFWTEIGVSQFTVTEIGTTNITLNTWHKVTIRYKRGNGDGEIQVYQNNVLTHTVSNVVTFPSALTDFTYASVNNYGEGRVSKTALGAGTGLGYSDILVDNWGEYVYGGPVPDADTGIANVFWPTGDASSSGSDEANSTSIWSTLRVTKTSDTTDPQEGSYSVKIVANEKQNFGTRGLASISSLTLSETYILDFYAKASNTASASIYVTNSVGGNQTANITSTAWTRYTIEFTTTTTDVQVRVNPFGDSGAGAIGDTIEMDNVRMYVKP